MVGADVVTRRKGSFNLFERGSQSEGWATGREDVPGGPSCLLPLRVSGRLLCLAGGAHEHELQA